ncbi:hypothetical protein ACFWH1_18835 [Streptomyces sp. NPDC127037]|uniref:hypothetical protein n=1 Tax=Streptomyces sp. NPDC127037 TaxID=3347113 RepID=UPI00364DC52F
MNTRAHCHCDRVLNYSYDEAAEALRCKRRFLEDRIRDLPHQKRGESVSFCPCELALIQAKTSYVPAWVLELSQPAPTPAPTGATPAVTALASIRPSRGRKRQAAAATG